jgi:hypothetical protein
MTEKLLITLFTCPKPFTNPHIAVIQRNAIRSWVELGPQVEVVLLGDEEGMADAAREMSVRHIREIKRNSQGTPLISSLFETARSVNQSPLLAYVNADIILLPDVVLAAARLLRLTTEFLMVGQRWDLEITEPVELLTGWQQRFQDGCRRSGKLHKPMGSDYFVFPRTCFSEIPDFAIGRAGWDNWMIYEARQRGWKTVDATNDVFVIHQQHDYSHLPGGQAHYRLPETGENVRLAGGKRHIFHLNDANLTLRNGVLAPKELAWNSFWREVEIFPIVRLHSEGLGKVLFAVFHPIKAYNEYRTSQKARRSREE